MVLPYSKPERALEGTVSKHALAPYQSGRSKTWLKTKCFTESTFVVVGMDRDAKPEHLEPYSLTTMALA